MVLRDEFRQRAIGKTASSFRQQIPLRTPSGPQWTESHLEAKAVTQIAFVPNCYDILTQPVIEYSLAGKQRIYTPDIACIFCSIWDHLPGRFVIEVKRQEDLRNNLAKYEDAFHAAREVCPEMGAAFRVLHEGHIDTAYYRNAVLLAKEVFLDPDVDAEDLLLQKFGSQSFIQQEAVEALNSLYPELEQRSEIVRNLIAWRMIQCDLMKDLTADSELRLDRPFRKESYIDPFLEMLQTMDSGVNI